MIHTKEETVKAIKEIKNFHITKISMTENLADFECG